MTGYVFPTDIVPQTASWGLVRQDVNQPSPLSGAVKRLVRGNASWRASVEWATLPTREKAQRLSAFLAQAGRGDNVIALSDPSYTAQGAVSGVLQVAGASQTGTSLTIDGCVASATVFAVGDYFTVGGELKQVTAPCIAAAAGAATVYFEPALRASPTDNAFLYVLTPWAPMYMPEGGFSFGHRPPKLSGLSLQFAEALGSESETVGPYIDLVRGRNELAAISPLLTVTRASTKYLQSVAGTLASFTTNVAGFAWNASAALLGLDVEGSRTNLMLQSQDFATTWSTARATISTDSTTAPDGASTADTITEDNTASNTHRTLQDSVKAASALTYAASVFVKRGSSGVRNLNMEINDGTGAIGVRVIFDPDDGTFALAAATFGSGFSGAAAYREQFGNGWWRVTLIGTTNSTTTARMLIGLADGVTTSYNGDNASNLYIWQAQLELASFSSSIIPTTTATVTRAADAISVSSISTALGFSATEGTIYCEFSLPFIETSAAAIRAMWAVNDTTANEEMKLRMQAAAADVDALVTDGGVSQADIDGPAAVASTALKTAVAWRANDIAYYASGASVGSDATATLPTVTRLQLGVDNAGNYLFGHIKNLRYYPRRLSAAELATLTT